MLRRDVGTAARVSASGNLADLLSYSVGLNYQNSYFRNIATSSRAGSQDNLGSGHSVTSYNYGFSFGLDKFLPRALGASFPVSMNYGKTTDVPLLRFGSDIILPPELQDREKSINVSKGISVSQSFNMKTKNPLFTVLLNRFKSNFSYSRSEGSSPSTPMSFNENYHVGGRYELNFNSTPSVRPFFWTKPIPLLKRLNGNRFYFFPNNFGVNGDFNRTLNLSENSSNVRTSNFRRDFKASMRLSYKISDNLNMNYNRDSRWDQTDPSKVSIKFNDFRLGRETNFSENLGVGYSPTVFGFFSHKFNFSSTYREDLNINDNTLTIGAGKSYGVSGDLSFKKLFSGKDDRQSRQTKMSIRTGARKEEEKEGLLAGILKPFSKTMLFLTNWINPITYEFNDRYNYSYTGLKHRAQWQFRYGIRESVGVPIDAGSTTMGRSTFTSKSTGYSFGSGTEFLGGLRADVTFNRKIDRDLIKPISPQKTVSTTFPDIRFSIRPLTTIKIFNPIIQRFNPRTGYSKSKSEVSFVQTGYKISERTSTAQRPLLAFGFDIFNGLNITVNTDRAVTYEVNYNSQNGSITNRRNDITTSQTISAKYSFSSPTGIKIPLFGRLKFNSAVSISVDISKRQQKPQSAMGDAPLISEGVRSDFMVTPNISYTFSSQIRGGLSARWQDTNDYSQQRKTHARELRIWVDINF